LKIANLSGRLSILCGDLALDVETASGWRFSADPQAVWTEWDRFAEWARGAGSSGARSFAAEDLGPPVPRPSQVFGIGLNYRDHAEEASIPIPSELTVFTKFASCLTGPFATVELPSAHVDYEVELVLVIGREGRRIRAADAWAHVAGVTIGQDLSERDVQLRPPVPQFSLGKSFPGFGPIGPAVATIDELADPDDLELGCRIGDDVLQKSRTSKMLFPVPDLLERLSAVVTLRAGDVVFTGTPAGVGIGRKPPRWLRPGEELESWIEGVGTMRQRLTA
jgi:2,4-didehydro-3-deoxy-L-rhamnonate hydrolase